MTEQKRSTTEHGKRTGTESRVYQFTRVDLQDRLARLFRTCVHAEGDAEVWLDNAKALAILTKDAQEVKAEPISALQEIDRMCADAIGEDARSTLDAEEVLMQIWKIARKGWADPQASPAADEGKNAQQVNPLVMRAEGASPAAGPQEENDTNTQSLCSEKGKILSFSLPMRLMAGMREAIYAHDVAEITRIYYEMWPGDKPEGAEGAASPEVGECGEPPSLEQGTVGASHDALRTPPLSNEHSPAVPEPARDEMRERALKMLEGYKYQCASSSNPRDYVVEFATAFASREVEHYGNLLGQAARAIPEVSGPVHERIHKMRLHLSEQIQAAEAEAAQARKDAEERDRKVEHFLEQVDYLLAVREIKCHHKGKDPESCANCRVRAAADSLRGKP